MRRNHGFTLIELMVVIAVVAVILTLAAPSFYGFILKQRLRSITAQLVTDLQFARSEAAARNTPVRVRFSYSVVPTLTCYILYTGASSGECSCINSPMCIGNGKEIKTVFVNDDLKVTVRAQTNPNYFYFDPATGAMVTPSLDILGAPAQKFVINTVVDSAMAMTTEVGLSGRPTVCAPANSTMGETACIP